MNDGDVVLIVGISARALAQSARRAKLTPVAIDAFGDQDTRAACSALTIAPDAARGFAEIDLDALVPPLIRALNPKGIVYGSGFDNCPDQLRRLAKHAPLLGASPETVSAAKDPIRFAGLCAAAGLLHPEVASNCPPRPEHWLLKRAGGCGGQHIRGGRAAQEPGSYWQKRIDGQALSLLFTRDSDSFVELAWSEQWTAPTDSAPYRYGGAAGPVASSKAPKVLSSLRELTKSLELRGLASADFLDDGESLWLLEINPRPGATVDVFDDDADPLILRHLNAVAGHVPVASAFRNPKAAGVVYAERNLIAPAGRWPDWAADQPSAGTVVPEGAPLCTVRAESDTIADAKTLLCERVRRIYDFAEGAAA